MISAQPAVPGMAVDELYQSLLSSRRYARQRLEMIQDIERRHRYTPLAELVDLAVTGALHQPDLGRDDVRKP